MTLIKHQLRICATIAICVSLVFIALVVRSTVEMRLVAEESRISQELMRDVFEISMLTNDYLRQPSERSVIQWEKRYDSLNSILNSPALQENVSTKTQKQLRKDLTVIHDYYNRIVKEISDPNKKTASESELSQFLTSELTLRMQSMVTQAFGMSHNSGVELAVIQQHTLSLFLFVIFLFTCLVLGLLGFAFWKILRPLSVLQQGTEIIGSGKLDHTINIRSKNEIGKLATAFNQMSKQLQHSYASLEKKVKDRTSELESALQETLKFQQAVASSTDAIYICTPDMKIIYANGALLDLSQYAQRDLEAASADIFLADAKQVKELRHSIKQTIKKQKPYHTNKAIYKRKDGTEFNAELTVYPVSHNKDVVYLVGIQHDITSRIQSERAKSEFVSLASHQLRTPLTAIGWGLQILQRHANKWKGITQSDKLILEDIFSGSVRMEETINTMLRLSQLEVGALKCERNSITLHSFLKEVCEQYEPNYSAKSQRLSLECPNSLSIVTDSRLLREVIANLLSNAIKYTPKAGTLSICCSEKEEAVVIKVQDSGYGIPADEQKHIFTKFFRGKNITSREQSGTGLGLYLVHLLVEKLGGTITFTSVEDKGTTFTLTFPKTIPDDVS